MGVSGASILAALLALTGEVADDQQPQTLVEDPNFTTISVLEICVDDGGPLLVEMCQPAPTEDGALRPEARSMLIVRSDRPQHCEYVSGYAIQARSSDSEHPSYFTWRRIRTFTAPVVEGPDGACPATSRSVNRQP